MRNLHEAALLLVDEGFGALPSWSDLAQGITPPAENSLDIEPGESRKGWQRLPSTCREKHHYERYMQSLDASSKARLRSSAGPNSSRWLYAIPSEKQFQLTCPLFRCAVQRRLGMKVDPAAAMCEGCHAHLDGYGWHRTTCMRTGRFQVRDKPLLHVCQRIFREAVVPIAIKNSLVEACDFTKNSLWVDDNDLALYWHGDLVASTRIDADVLQVAFGPTWPEYLEEINVTDLYAQSNEVLQMSLASRAKGKGKGKGKGEGKHDVAHPTQVFGVSMEDY